MPKDTASLPVKTLLQSQARAAWEPCGSYSATRGITRWQCFWVPFIQYLLSTNDEPAVFPGTGRECGAGVLHC